MKKFDIKSFNAFIIGFSVFIKGIAYGTGMIKIIE